MSELASRAFDEADEWQHGMAVAKDDRHWAAAARVAAERIHLGCGAVSGVPSHLAGRVSHGRACLLFLAEHEGASNRDIADALGMSHSPQASRLLSRLCAERLVDKRSQGTGKRNEWRLTKRGTDAVAAILDGGLPAVIESSLPDRVPPADLGAAQRISVAARTNAKSA
ncbi:MAG TPA: helix-turn-helix domain-containing protein [Solirubrobacteraceae bacterium]